MDYAKYTKGSLSENIFRIAFPGSLAMALIYLADFIEIFLIADTENINLIAALGFSGSLLLLMHSVCFGLSVGCGATMAYAAGVLSLNRIRALLTHLYLIIFVGLSVFTLIIWVISPYLLSLIGASGSDKIFSMIYLRIVLVGTPIIGLTMAVNSSSRSLGSGTTILVSALIGSFSKVALDLLLISYQGLGIVGAAIATLVSRTLMFIYAVHFARSNRYIYFAKHMSTELIFFFLKITTLTITTNLITPIGSAYTTYILSRLGSDTVSGYAIIEKIQYLVYSVPYGLSTASGAISGQNFGIRNISRISNTFYLCVKYSSIYVLVVLVILFLSNETLINAFEATELAEHSISIYANGLSLVIFFNCIIFIANSTLTNIGMAHLATLINLLKSVVFSFPLIYLGYHYFDLKGVYTASLASSCIAAIYALYVTHLKIKQISNFKGRTL